MSKRKVLVLELLTAGPARGWYSRWISHPNYYGVMASVIAVWCEDLGAEVTYRTYTGREPPEALLAGEWDVAFVSSYTRAAWTAYTCAHLLRARGTVTALGGPHAHAYPDASRRWFDFVLGFTDKEAVREVLEGVPYPDDEGRWIDRGRNPARLPGLERRAHLIDAALEKAWLLRAVPLLASSGCPYACSFCSDADVSFLPADLDAVEADVRFARDRWPDALLVWHDPNFGVRFDALLGAIERALDGRPARFLAESSLSLLSRDRLARMARVGFIGLLPGIENWSGYGVKMGLPRASPEERMQETATRLHDMSRLIPFLQVNFVFGVDPETEREEAALTREFRGMAKPPPAPGLGGALSPVPVPGEGGPAPERALPTDGPEGLLQRGDGHAPRAGGPGLRARVGHHSVIGRPPSGRQPGLAGDVRQPTARLRSRASAAPPVVPGDAVPPRAGQGVPKLLRRYVGGRSGAAS